MPRQYQLVLRAPLTPAYVRQAQQWAAGDDVPATSSLTFTVLAGSSMLVYVQDAYLISPSAPVAPTISDTQSGSYTYLGYVTEAGYTDALHCFVRSNVASGSLTVTCNWNGGSNQWHGFAVAEIAGVSASPTLTTVSSNVYNPSGANAISSGNLSLGSSPALVVALCENYVNIGASADGYPSAGTGFTSELTAWNWGGKEGTSYNNIAQLESRYYASPGTVAATFTPRTAGDQSDGFLTYAVAFQ